MYHKHWQTFKKMAEADRIPHALLFSGWDLAGIKNLALEFIKLINGQEALAGTHPDLFILEPEEQKEIRISQIRALHSRLSLKSYFAPFKTVIIDRAHLLNQEAQSAFLKLLEEPKGQTLFILITEYPNLLLDTILSRVEHFKFYSDLPPLHDFQKKTISEMLRVRKGDLTLRFQYAKELAEDPQNLGEVLEGWLRYLREILLSNPYQPKIAKILRTIQTMHFLLSTTNINPRLALEVLMLEL